MYDDPAFRPLRWIGAIAVFGVVFAALAVLAWEAIGESFVYIGDGSSQGEVIVLASDAPAEGGDAAAETPADEGADADTADQDDDAPSGLYEIQPGDTGSSIARELFGRQDAWAEIAAYNDMDPNETLTVGETLRIPEL